MVKILRSVVCVLGIFLVVVSSGEKNNSRKSFNVYAKKWQARCGSQGSRPGAGEDWHYVVQSDSRNRQKVAWGLSPFNPGVFLCF